MEKPILQYLRERLAEYYTQAGKTHNSFHCHSCGTRFDKPVLDRNWRECPSCGRNVA